jgi:aspartate kinase
MMKVLKFGGTSLGNASRMLQVAEIIRREEDCIVVCSAMTGVTNTLTDIARLWSLDNSDRALDLLSELHHLFNKTCYDLFPDFSDASESLDMLVAHFTKIGTRLNGSYTKRDEYWLLAQGEIITCNLFVDFLNANGDGFKLMNAFDFLHLGNNGEPSLINIHERILRLYGPLNKGRYLTQGFICTDYLGYPYNLQRGGSDYTATLIGAAMAASVIEIWTDIDGLRNNDPRFVPDTFSVRELSFGEAAELAYFGAKILHPSCVWPARSNNIPIYLKNTMEPSSPGTIIRRGPDSQGIKAVAAKDGITMIRIRSARMLNAYGFLRRIFEIFETWKTPIDVITTSEVAVSLTIDNPEFLEKVNAELKELGEVTIEQNLSIICIVGDVLAEHQGYAAQIMEALKHLQVKMISFGGSHNNLTVVLPQRDKQKALLALQKGLFQTTEQNDLAMPNKNIISN